MTEKDTSTSRRTVLKKCGVGIAGLAGASAAIGTGSAARGTNHHAEYRCQRHGSVKQGLSKLQIRVDWVSRNGTIQQVDTDVVGRANAVGHSFKGIRTRNTSGGNGKKYFQIYVEGDYSSISSNYTHWMDMTVRAGGYNTANCNWKLEFVSDG